MKLAGQYAKALYELQKEEKLEGDVAVSKLIKLLKAKGHIKLLPSIVSEFEKIMSTGRDEETMTITCARKEDFSNYKNELKEHMGHQNSEFTREVVDDSIIGGFIIQKGETIIDGSYKKKLLLLYQNAIA